MKISFLLAKHFWEDGKDATWLKSEKFDINVFEKFKQEYTNLSYNPKPYIEINNKILFLFYNTKKDFSNRDIVEITGFLTDIKFKDNQKIYEILQNSIDIESNYLEYKIKIDKSNIVNTSFIFYIVLFTIVFISISVYFIFVSPENTNTYNNKQSKIPVKEKEYTNIKEKIIVQSNVKYKNNIIHKVNIDDKNNTIDKISKDDKIIVEPMSKKQKNKNKFCKKYNKLKGDFCYIKYIKNKCSTKSDFMSYIEYGQSKCPELMGINDIKEDEDLTSKNFRKKELSFFK